MGEGVASEVGFGDYCEVGVGCNEERLVGDGFMGVALRGFSTINVIYNYRHG